MKKINISFLSKLNLKAPFTADAMILLACLVSILIKCVYFQFTTDISHLSSAFMEIITMLLSTIAVLMMIFSPFLLLRSKFRIAAFFAVNLFYSLLLFSDLNYFRYYQNVVTVPVLYQLRLVGSVGGSVISLLNIRDILLVLDFPLLILFLLFLNKKRTPTEKPFSQRAKAALILFLSGLLLVQYPIHSIEKDTLAFNNNYIISKLGIPYFHYYDIKRFVNETYLHGKVLSYSEQSEIQEFFTNHAMQQKKTELSGALKGKNLIIVQVEAFQSFVVNKTYRGQEITPHFNRLMKDSLYFNNIFYQTGGGNTSDAEFLVNNSIYPMNEGAVYFRFPANTYFSLPKLLKQSGYNTYVFHANEPSFWNRAEMYKAVGFDHFIHKNDYHLDETIGWGLGDKSFYRQSLDKIDTSKPFYSFMVSLSSHHPFDFFKEYTEFDAGEYSDTFFGNYLKAIHYADSALGNLVDELKKRGLDQNTVLVIYGDHMAIPKNQSESLQSFLNYSESEFDWLNLQKVPCLIHFPGLKNGTVSDVIGGEIDLLPTLANLMGFNPPYAMGKDLLSTEEGYAVLRNGSVITQDYLFASENNTFYSPTGNIIEGSQYKEDMMQKRKELYISDLINKKNALQVISSK